MRRDPTLGAPPRQCSRRTPSVEKLPTRAVARALLSGACPWYPLAGYQVPRPQGIALASAGCAQIPIIRARFEGGFVRKI